MLQKIDQLATLAYIRFLFMKEDLRDLKNDERGIDGIVVAVILVLVAVLAAVAFRKQLANLVNGIWDSINGSDINGNEFN